MRRRVNEDEIVADASAVLAALKGERFDKVDPELVVRCSISAVNFSEVLAKLHADGLTEAQADAAIARLDLQVVAFDRQQAADAAKLWPETRRFGLSLADRACLALGLALGRTVVTADRIWASLDVGVEILLIR
jgi:ribonuclease VapC